MLKKSKDLIEAIVAKTGLYNYQVKSVINSLVEEVLGEMSRGKPVHIINLGKFWVKFRSARKGWDPYKKEHIQLPPRAIPKFNFSKGAYETIRDKASRLAKKSEKSG